MIFLELVPRNYDNLLRLSTSSLESHSLLTGINIPDIKRLDIRSFEAVSFLLKHNIRCLPHIRAQDYSLKDHLDIISPLIQMGLKELLVISGDPIQKGVIPEYKSTVCELVSILKSTFSSLTVYCGIDPYRQSLNDEINYAYQKIDAGADGLFSQPFFDLTLLDTVLSHFTNTQFFAGIAPVTKQSSFDYWVNVNKVTFPKAFCLELDYNFKLAQKIIGLATSYNQHCYLMPIKTPIQNYLNGVFNT